VWRKTDQQTEVKTKKTYPRDCQVCRSFLLSGRNVRWPRRMLPPGESRRVCWRDRQTDGRTSDRYIMLSARRGQHNKKWTYDRVDHPCAPWHDRMPWQASAACRHRRTREQSKHTQKLTRHRRPAAGRRDKVLFQQLPKDFPAWLIFWDQVKDAATVEKRTVNDHRTLRKITSRFRSSEYWRQVAPT